MIIQLFYCKSEYVLDSNISIYLESLWLKAKSRRNLEVLYEWLKVVDRNHRFFTTKAQNVVKRSNIQSITFLEGHFFRLNFHSILNKNFSFLQNLRNRTLMFNVP